MEEAWFQALSHWASGKVEISKLFVFGSRARGDHTKKSDLDVGVVVRGTPSDPNILAIWIDEGRAWGDELDSLLPIKVDIQLANPELSETVVAPAIEKEGVLIYERKT